MLVALCGFLWGGGGGGGQGYSAMCRVIKGILSKEFIKWEGQNTFRGNAPYPLPWKKTYFY